MRAPYDNLGFGLEAIRLASLGGLARALGG
jgi:hypothetical protein